MRAPPRGRYTTALVFGLIAVSVTLQGCFSQQQAEDFKAWATTHVSAAWNGVIGQACSKFVKTTFDSLIESAYDKLQEACIAVRDNTEIDNQCVDDGAKEIEEAKKIEEYDYTEECIANVTNWTNGVTDSAHIQDAMAKFKSLDWEKMKNELDAWLNSVLDRVKAAAEAWNAQHPTEGTPARLFQLKPDPRLERLKERQRMRAKSASTTPFLLATGAAVAALVGAAAFKLRRARGSPGEMADDLEGEGLLQVE